MTKAEMIALAQVYATIAMVDATVAIAEATRDPGEALRRMGDSRAAYRTALDLARAIEKPV